MKNYVENQISELISAGRKQIKKEQIYDKFLKQEELTSQNVPKHEFIEVIESLSKTNTSFRTTQKLIKLIY